MGLKAHAWAADRSLVSVTHPAPLQGIDGILSQLPSDWVVGGLGQARLVIGPSGAFVLVPGDSDDDLAVLADRAQGLANRTRTALARHLSWVPFVDAAIITRGDRPTEAAAVVVPVDLLGELLIAGPPTIDGPTLTVLRGLLGKGSIDGWHAGIDEVDVSIDLCETPGRPSRAHL
jgi:hypothetical protein